MSRRYSILTALLVLVALGLSVNPSRISAQAAAEPVTDWPQFRGSDRTNKSPDTGLLKSWPKDGPKLVWKGDGLGFGYSSVSVAGNKIFTMGDKEGSSYVFALDRATGKLLWSTKVGKPEGGPWPGTRCTPTVDGNLVYAIGQYGDLVCLDTATGEKKWGKNFEADYGGKARGWKFAESPLIDGERLVFTPGGPKATIVALNKTTGEEIWRSPANQTAGYSSIVISKAGDVKQYVTLTAGGTIGVAAEDGKPLWLYKKLGVNTANIPTPLVVDKNQVFTTAGYGKGGALLSLSPGKEGFTIKEEYYKSELKNKHGGVVAVGDYIYGDFDDKGQPFCVKWKDGTLQPWKRSTESKGRGSMCLTYADGHLYVRYQNGIVALVPATPKGYSETSSFVIPNTNKSGAQQSWAYPVVIDGKLYLREKDTVFCYDVKAPQAK